MRAVRGLWPDRNPLRRTVDRAESLIVPALAVAFLAGAPLAAVATGHAVYGYGARAGPLAGPGRDAAGRLGSRVVGARAGAAVRVWVDAAGRVTGPPLQPTQVAGQAWVAATFAPMLAGRWAALSPRD